MNRPRMGLIALALTAIVFHGPAAGQTSAEVRGGVAVGGHSGTAAGMEMVPSAAFDVLVLRQVTPLFRIYGGLTRTSFGCEEGFCLDLNPTVTGTHGVVGAEAQVAKAWGRLGILFGKTEVGDQDDADMGPGIQLAAGFVVGTGRVQILPGLSYRWMSAKTPAVSEHAIALGADVGIRIGLGR